MGLQVLIGMAVGGVALYAGYRRVRGYGEHVRYRNSVERFQRDMKAYREELLEDRVVRVATAADAELVEMIDVATAERAEIESNGFTRLGDIVEDIPDLRPTAIVRVFVDSAGTTIAALSVRVHAPRQFQSWLISFHGEEQYATRRLERTLAQPPNMHAQTLATDTPYRTMVEKHRELAKFDGALRVRSIEDVAAAIGRMRAHLVRWRAAQPPDELLDADLRGVLGERYDSTGKFWARQLREELPGARLHRNSRP